MTKASLIAPIPKLVSETGITKRTVPIVHKERQVTASRTIYDPLQRGQDGQRQPLGFAIASFVLRERELPSFDVLFPKPDDVGAPLTREQQECKREPRLASDRVAFLELLYFLRIPSMESGWARFEIFNIAGRVAWSKLFLDSELENLPHGFDASVSGLGRVNLAVA